MKRKVRKVLLILVMIMMPLSVTACGSHPMTTKELLEAEDQYERGKISYVEYLEALDAYYNGDPAPKRGIMKFISNVFKIIGYILLGGIALIIVFVIYLFRRR